MNSFPPREESVRAALRRLPMAVNSNVVKFHDPDDMLPYRPGDVIGEVGGTVAGRHYRNVNVTGFDGYVYLVSHKAVLTINLTPVCNANCDFCYNGITFFPGEGPLPRRSPELERVVRFAVAGGIKNVSVSGGEPTSVPDLLLEVTNQLKAEMLGFRRLHTNGSHLWKSVEYRGERRPLHEWLRETGVTDISISRAHHDRERNAAIMRMPLNGSVGLEKIGRLVVSGTRVRLSCYIHRNGIDSPLAMLEYIARGVDAGVRDFVFRISSDIPNESALSSAYTVANRVFPQRTSVFEHALERSGFSVAFRRHENDYDLYILRRGDITVSVDRASDIVDPDRKIRRLVFMPNGVCYTSWLDATSYLFPTDRARLVGASSKPLKINGAYPAHRARRHYGGRPEGEPIADLHVHSTLSDGHLSPSEVLRALVDAGIRTAVFVEHNGVHDNFAALQSVAASKGVRIPFPGAEASVCYVSPDERFAFRFHALVFGDGLLDPEFRAWLESTNAAVNEYLAGLYYGLVASGIDLPPLDEVFGITEADDRLRSRRILYHRRPLALALARVTGLDMAEVRRRFLPPVPEEVKYARPLLAHDLLTRARQKGTVVVLAHPGWVRNISGTGCGTFKDVLDAIITMRRAGLDGVEVDHRVNTPEQSLALSRLAFETDMLVTGGSDFHGRENDRLGIHGTSERTMEQLHHLLAVRLTMAAKVATSIVPAVSDGSS